MIAAVIPTLNEEKGVAEVVKGFPDTYRDHEIEVFVVDGGSSDRTVQEAEEAGAEVLLQRLSGGKGDALRQAFDQVDAEYYVMIDGDGTYDPSEVGRLLDPLMDGEAGQVIGKRTEREKGSIPLLNRFGNWIFNLIATLATGDSVNDILSGYRALTRDSLERTSITRPGFGVETELTYSAVENNVVVKEVEVSYSKRKGESKLDPVRDGWRIFKTALWSVRDLAPLKFFSAAAFMLLLIAVYPSYLVFEEKLAMGRVQSLGPIVFSAMCIILAMQMMVFGMLADQVKNVEKRLRSGQ